MESEHNIQQDPSGNSSLAEIFSLKNIVFVVIVIAIAGGAFYFMWMKRQKPLVVEKPAPSEITLPVVPVVKKTLFREDQLPGEINAYQDVLIYPKVPGFVKELNVDRGSVVKKGQLMVRMYAPEYLAKRSLERPFHCS